MTGFIFDMEPDVLQPTCVTGLLFYTQELHVFCAVHRSIESRHFLSSFHRSIARFCQVITVVLVDVPCGSEKDLYTLKRAVAGPAWSQNTRAARAGPASDQRGFPKRGALPPRRGAGVRKSPPRPGLAGLLARARIAQGARRARAFAKKTRRGMSKRAHMRAQIFRVSPGYRVYLIMVTKALNMVTEVV